MGAAEVNQSTHSNCHLVIVTVAEAVTGIAVKAENTLVAETRKQTKIEEYQERNNNNRSISSSNCRKK